MSSRRSKPVVVRRKAVSGRGAYSTKSRVTGSRSMAMSRSSRPMAMSRSISGRGSYYRKPVIRGRGAYKKDYGARLGSVVGEGVQEALAQLLPHIGKLVGFGDYAQTGFSKNIRNNSLISMGLDPPEIKNSKMGGVIIRHREYLQDVLTGASGAFSLQSFDINPGLPGTFPWLSQIAPAFEQYRLRGMIFEFKSTSADALNSTNTALGSVIMATEYDATKPNFGNKLSMENHEYSSSARQSSSMLHPIECARRADVLTELYVRDGTQPGVDQRFTDFGNFQIATIGGQSSNVNIGELWITYEIELLKPQQILTQGGGGTFYTGHIMAVSGVTATNPFGTNLGPANITGNLGITISGTNKNIVTIPSWVEVGTQFLVYYCAYGTSAVVTSPTFSVSTNLALINAWNADSQNGANNTGSTSPVNMNVLQVLVTSTVAPLTITISSGGYPTGTVSSDFWITNVVPGTTVDEDETEEEEEDKMDVMLDSLAGIKDSKIRMEMLELYIRAREKEKALASPVFSPTIEELTPTPKEVFSPAPQPSAPQPSAPQPSAPTLTLTPAPQSSFETSYELRKARLKAELDEREKILLRLKELSADDE